MKFFKYVLMNTAGEGGAGGGASAGAAAGGGAAAGAGGSGAPAGASAASGGAAASGSSGGAPGPASAAAGAGANGGAASGAAGSGASAPDWTSGLNDDFKGLVQNKGWKAPSDALESYRNMEKLLGAPQDQVIRLPKADDAAGWEGVFSRLGRPATPEGYKLEIPKENGSPEFAKAASETFHKLGLSEKQGQELVNWWNGFQKTAGEALAQEFQARVAQENTGLKREWGAAYDQNVAVADRACNAFGVDSKMMGALAQALGSPAAAVKFMHNIGSKLGEGSFHNGKTSAGNGALTPQQAQARIKELKGDAGFGKRYMEGDVKAREEMETLHKFAFPDAS